MSRLRLFFQDALDVATHIRLLRKIKAAAPGKQQPTLCKQIKTTNKQIETCIDFYRSSLFCA